MKAKVLDDVCVGCGVCVSICPDVFVMEGDKAVVQIDTVPGDAEQSCINAAEDCPVASIVIDD